MKHLAPCRHVPMVQTKASVRLQIPLVPIHMYLLCISKSTLVSWSFSPPTTLIYYASSQVVPSYSSVPFSTLYNKVLPLSLLLLIFFLSYLSLFSLLFLPFSTKKQLGHVQPDSFPLCSGLFQVALNIPSFIHNISPTAHIMEQPSQWFLFIALLFTVTTKKNNS